ncbi:zinc finger protein 501-like [Anopheles cruzii]|uniref:zinc finger protein 501-like n=1 Tax=Anopheles cruzii TaxID=68878 RepID=UPI0022EC63CF|nr:zinc finger protein 501-like [Anopheles cruzii]
MTTIPNVDGAGCDGAQPEPARCALCLADGPIMLSIDDEKDNMSATIQLHLALDLDKSQSEYRHRVCGTCWKVVSEFHSFYLMVHDAQSDQRKFVVEDSLKDPLAPSIGYRRGSSGSSDDAQSCKSSPLRDSTEILTEPTTKATRKGNSNIDSELLEFYQRIVCHICDKMPRSEEAAIEYQTLAQLNRHMRTVHNLQHGTLRCPVCGLKNRTRAQLWQHKEMHLRPDQYRCTVCQEVHQNLEQHTRKRHGDRVHICEQCGRRFALPGRLAVHVRKSHGERDVMCDQCNKPFNRYTIDDHKRNVHHASFICEYCPKTFKSRFWLNRHAESHADGTDGKARHAVSCTVCGTVVKNKYILVAHMRRIHSDQPAVSCGTCGKPFKSQRHLNGHLRTVCTEQAFPCAVCGRKFKKKIKLREHMTTHTGMPLYACTFCPQTFNYESHFYTHRKVAHREQWLELQQKRKDGYRS